MEDLKRRYPGAPWGNLECMVHEMLHQKHPFVGYLHNNGCAVYRTDRVVNNRPQIALPWEGGSGRTAPPGSITMQLRRSRYESIVQKLRKRRQLLATVASPDGETVVWADEEANQ